MVPILSPYTACHTLTRIKGEVVGDPLDLKMLAFTQYELDEPAATNTKQTNVDMLFPTIMRPINFLTNASPTRLSRSDSSLINDVSKSIMAFLFIGFRLVLFFLQHTPFEVGIVRQLPFSSSLQRTSVIIRILARNSFDLLSKGSPEKIAELSRHETSECYILFFELFSIYFLISSEELR